jgi:uracil-DNA glycosylase
MTTRNHRDPAFLASKLELLGQPHIAPLTKMVHEIQNKHQGVPFFDPADGGVNANVLMLLEAPGPKAMHFVSMDNDDQTAANLNKLVEESGVPRTSLCLWNVVPFYIGTADRSKLRAANQSDLDAGRPWLFQLLSLMPSLKSVVLLGRQAQKSELLISELRPDVSVFPTWHPSNRAINSGENRRAEITSALRSAFAS